MNEQRNILCCDQNTSLNARENDQKPCPPKRDECGPKILDCPPKVVAECGLDVGQCAKTVECAASKPAKTCTPRPVESAPAPPRAVGCCAPRAAVVCAPEKAECGHSKAATDPERKTYGCCAMPPVARPPRTPNGPCIQMTTCNGTVCNAANRGCAETESIGQQFDMQTERLKSKCACVKFNGLQDTCRHPDCHCRVGCLNIPFPNCPPAQKWRKDFACRKTKKNNEC